MGASCASSKIFPQDCRCAHAPDRCSLRRYEDPNEYDEDAGMDYSDSLGRPAMGMSALSTQESVSEDAASDLSAIGEPDASIFGDDAENALIDETLACRELRTQAILNRLREISVAEDGSPQGSSRYFDVLQQVLDLFMTAIYDVSGGHMWILVTTIEELARLQIAVLDNGVLSQLMKHATIQDRSFQKRVWFYKSWLQQYDVPVQGGFVIERSTGGVLAAAVNFLCDASPLKYIHQLTRDAVYHTRCLRKLWYDS